MTIDPNQIKKYFLALQMEIDLFRNQAARVELMVKDIQYITDNYDRKINVEDDEIFALGYCLGLLKTEMNKLMPYPHPDAEKYVELNQISARLCSMIDKYQKKA